MKDTRFTLRVAGDFHRQVSERAAAQGLTVTAVILGLLAAWLQGEAAPSLDNG